MKVYNILYITTHARRAHPAVQEKSSWRRDLYFNQRRGPIDSAKIFQIYLVARSGTPAGLCFGQPSFWPPDRRILRQLPITDAYVGLDNCPNSLAPQGPSSGKTASASSGMLLSLDVRCNQSAGRIASRNVSYLWPEPI